MAADYPLERGFRAIRRDFGIYAPTAPEQSKNNGFAASAAASDPPDPEAAFSHFGFTADRRFRLTIAGDSFPEGGSITVNGVAVQPCCRGDSRDIRIRSKKLFLPAMTRFQPFAWLSYSHDPFGFLCLQRLLS